jgi:hypothetical protein
VDAFRVHKQLIHDYRSFSEGFVDIRDERIACHVRAQAHKGRQWPEPWLALNPSFATGGGIDELVVAGKLLTRVLACPEPTERAQVDDAIACSSSAAVRRYACNIARTHGGCLLRSCALLVYARDSTACVARGVDVRAEATDVRSPAR